MNAAEGLACPAGFGLGPGAAPGRVWGRYWAIPGRAHAAFRVRGGRRPLRDSTLTQGSRCHMAACRQQADGAGVRPGGPGRPRTPPPKRRSFTLFLMRGICGTRSGAPRRTPASGRRRWAPWAPCRPPPHPPGAAPANTAGRPLPHSGQSIWRPSLLPTGSSWDVPRPLPGAATRAPFGPRRALAADQARIMLPRVFGQGSRGFERKP